MNEIFIAIYIEHGSLIAIKAFNSENMATIQAEEWINDNADDGCFVSYDEYKEEQINQGVIPEDKLSMLHLNINDTDIIVYPVELD